MFPYWLMLFLDPSLGIRLSFYFGLVWVFCSFFGLVLVFDVKLEGNPERAPQQPHGFPRWSESGWALPGEALLRTNSRK